TGNVVNANVPSSPLASTLFRPVSVWITVTDAPAITAPVESLRTPLIEPVETWADTTWARKPTLNTAAHVIVRMCISGAAIRTPPMSRFNSVGEVSHNVSKLFPVVNRNDEKRFHLAELLPLR